MLNYQCFPIPPCYMAQVGMGEWLTQGKFTNGILIAEGARFRGPFPPVTHPQGKHWVDNMRIQLPTCVAVIGFGVEETGNWQVESGRILPSG